MELNEKTYSFTSVINGVTTYIERSAGVVAGFARLTAQAVMGRGKRGQQNSVRSKTVWKLSIPTVADDNSACACDGDVLSQIDVFVEVRSDASTTTTQLEEALAELRDLVETSQFGLSFTQHVQPSA